METIFVDDLEGQPAGGMPRYWALAVAPGGYVMNNVDHLRVADRQTRKTVEARVPEEYAWGSAVGPHLEQVWDLSATISGDHSFERALPGWPCYGVGQRFTGDDYVRFGYGKLSPQDADVWIMARGRQGGEEWAQTFLLCSESDLRSWRKLRLRLIPTMQFFLDDVLIGERDEGMWNLGGRLQVEMSLQEFSRGGDVAFSFYGLQASGMQPYETALAADGVLSMRAAADHSRTDSAWWGVPVYWFTAVERSGGGGDDWQSEAFLSHATHLAFLPQPTQRWYATWFDPIDASIYWGTIGGADVKILEGYYYPSAALLPEAGMAILVCYQEGALFAFRGTMAVGAPVSWDVDNPALVADGNAFPQRATIAAEPSGRLRVIYLDRDYQLQERVSDDFGSTWTAPA